MADSNTETARRTREQLHQGVRTIEVRNNTYVPLLRRQDYHEAKSVLDELLQHAPQDILLRRDAASLYMKLKMEDAAVEQIDQAMKHAEPADTPVAAHAIQIKIAAGHLHDAVSIAFEHRQYWDKHLRLAYMSLLALTRQENPNTSDILHLAKVVVSALDATPTMREKAGAILLGLGEARTCAEALTEANIAQEGTATESFLLAKALHLSDRQSDAIDPLLDRCLMLQPGHPQASELRGIRHLEANEPQAAIDCLRKVARDDYTKGIKLNLATALSNTGEQDQSVALFKEVVNDHPSNGPLRKKIAGVLAKNGQDDQAKALYLEGVTLRAGALKPTFEAAVRSLMVSAVTTDIPKFRTDWLYDKLLERGKAPPDKAKWEASVHRHHALDKLIVDWVECRPDAFEQIRPFLAQSDDTLRLLDEETAKGKGLIVASAHVGILFSGPVILRCLGYQFAWLASLPDLKRDRIDESLISTTTNNEQDLTRSFLRALNDGKVVTVAIDGSAEKQRSKYPFLGEVIGLSEFVPMIAFRKKTPTVFPKLIWKDGQVHATLKRLPDPEAREDAATFVARWMESFLKELEKMVIVHHCQPRLAGGFWSTLIR